MSAKQNLTTSPAILGNDTSLAVETDYTIQNRSATVAYVEVTTSSPTDNTTAFSVSPQAFATIKRPTGENVYVWQPSGSGAGIIVWDESA